MEKRCPSTKNAPAPKSAAAIPRMIPRTVGWATTNRTPSMKSRSGARRSTRRVGDGCCPTTGPGRGMVAISAAEARNVSESTPKARATSPSIGPEAVKTPPTLASRAKARAPTGSMP